MLSHQRRIAEHPPEPGVATPPALVRGRETKQLPLSIASPVVQIGHLALSLHLVQDQPPCAQVLPAAHLEVVIGRACLLTSQTAGRQRTWLTLL